MSPDTKKGFRFEKDVTNGLQSELEDRGLTNHYRLIPSGFSGNHGISSGDLDIVGPNDNHVLELKNCSNDVCTLEYDGEDEDLDQLADCAQTVHTRSWIGVKFKRRELVMVELDDPSRPAESLVENCPTVLNPRATRTGNFKMDNPSTDVWPSSRSGRDDTDVLLDAFGITGAGVEDQSFDIEVEA